MYYPNYGPALAARGYYKFIFLRAASLHFSFSRQLERLDIIKKEPPDFVC